MAYTDINSEDRLVQEQNHRYVFSLIHKFNQDVKPDQPYSDRDDIIVISDEAHRTQAGKLARNMRLALPNAAFIGFTGTPLFKHDELTKRIFGDYVSRYDFKRSEEDGATVKLVYENRGEKPGLAKLDLNDKIAAAVDAADLDTDQTALLEKLLGKDYTEDQLALFDLLKREPLNGADLEMVKQESRSLLAELQRLIAPLGQWTEKEQTQAEVEVFILDHVYQALPEPPYTPDDKKVVAELVYRHIWQKSATGGFAAR